MSHSDDNDIYGNDNNKNANGNNCMMMIMALIITKMII